MPAELLPWNDENICAVLTDLLGRSVNDQALHQQLMTDPFSVLSQYLDIPPEYQKNIYSKPGEKPGMLFSVPPYQGELEAGASPAKVQPNYVVFCTGILW